MSKKKTKHEPSPYQQQHDDDAIRFPNDEQPLSKAAQLGVEYWARNRVDDEYKARTDVQGAELAEAYFHALFLMSELWPKDLPEGSTKDIYGFCQQTLPYEGDWLSTVHAEAKTVFDSVELVIAHVIQHQQ